MATIRVSVKPYVYQGLAGYRVRWENAKGKTCNYFVQSLGTALTIKDRVKADKSIGKRWAVKF